MNQQSVLILGAGLMQKPAIISAKNAGFYTYVIDANPAAESVVYADEFKKCAQACHKYDYSLTLH